MHRDKCALVRQAPPDREGEWGVFHARSDDIESHPDPEAAFKLVSPQPRVARALEMSGFSRLLSIFEDRESALVSFSAAVQ
ncbi:MAG TPA: hypothetical protein VE553_08895 [Candidatus Binatia bacterium]|nr:hypothetical protein [Candidatus Binatia bacterium]